MTTTAGSANMATSRSTVPSRSAKRLAGVTRSRSITPESSSQITTQPAPIPAPKAIRARMPGTKTSSTRPAGRPLTARDGPEQRLEQRKVQQRSAEPGNDPDRLAQRFQELAAEEQAGVQRERHAATCPSACWRRLHRPVVARVAQRSAGLMQEHIVEGRLGERGGPDRRCRGRPAGEDCCHRPRRVGDRKADTAILDSRAADEGDGCQVMFQRRKAACGQAGVMAIVSPE